MQIRDPVLIFAVVMLVMLAAPLLFARLRVPGLIGLIVAGIAVGPHGFGWLAQEGTFELLGTVGLLYLMFLAGLEINPQQLRGQRKDTLVFGLLTFLIPQLLGTVGAVCLLGMDLKRAILLASMFASHTLVSYPIARRLGIQKDRAVTAAVGGTVLTDTLALLVLAVIAESVNAPLTMAFWARQLTLLALLVAFTLTALPRIGYWFFRRMTPEGGAEYTFVLAATFFTAWLSHLARVEPIIGAFLAGLALSRLVPERSVLMNRLHFVGETLFIPFFLLSVGMRVDLGVFFQGWRALGVALFMCLTVLLTKGGAAWMAGRALGFSGDQRGVLFGLSVNQAAATLAAVLVGVRLGFFDDAALNGTIAMILVSCIVGPWFTERHGRALRLRRQADADAAADTERPPRLLIPLSNRNHAERLADLAILLRRGAGDEPLHFLTVADSGNEADSDARVAAGERMLGVALVQAVAAGVPALPATRIDANPAAGILRAARELRATLLLLGWSGRSKARHLIFHPIPDQVLEQTRLPVIIARLPQPLNTMKRLFVAVPPLLPRQAGYAETAATLRILAAQTGAELHVIALNSARESALRFSRPLRAGDAPVFHGLNAWSELIPLLREFCRPGDAWALLSVRPGRLAWHPSLAKLPARLAELGPTQNLLVTYLSEREDDPPEETARRPEFQADTSVRLASLAHPLRRMALPSGTQSDALDRLLRELLPERAPPAELRERLAGMEPVELGPGIALYHAHTGEIGDSRAALARAPEPGWTAPGIAGPVRAVILLLSAAGRPPEHHLAALADLARFVRAPEFPAWMNAADVPHVLPVKNNRSHPADAHEKNRPADR